MNDNDQRKWIYKEHTRVKHELLDKYLGGWIPILGSRNGRLLIFDGFAGRGEYEDGTPGSPQLIMSKASEIISKGQAKQVLCAFVENDPDNFRNLKNQLDAIKPRMTNVNLLGPYNEEFATVAEQAIASVNGKSIPSFFFIDPFGFSGVPFDVVKRILSLGQSEVFITFMLRDIARFLSHPNLNATFDSLYGTSDWRKIVSSNAVNQEKEHQLRNLYMDQLADLGSYVTTFRVCMDEKLQTLYYMIHASNHPKGRILMKEVMARQGAGGVFAYLGPKDSAARVQLSLFAEDIPELQTLLLKKFEGRAVTYGNVQLESCMDTDLIDRDYRKALQELRKEAKVLVKPVTSKTERGLKGADIITFPKI